MKKLKHETVNTKVRHKCTALNCCVYLLFQLSIRPGVNVEGSNSSVKVIDKRQPISVGMVCETACLMFRTSNGRIILTYKFGQYFRNADCRI